MSSLIKKKLEVGNERESLTSKSDVIEGLKKKNREYHKDRRVKHLDSWKAVTAEVATLSGNELLSYIERADQLEPRIGNHSMKVNGLELAIIKLAIEISGARSSRALFIEHCKNVIRKESDGYHSKS